MATIGQLTEEKGAYFGRVRTLSHRLMIEMEPVEGKRGDASPDFTVYARENGDLIPVGSAWKKEVQHGANKGDRFLSITLDDPSFPSALNCAAFPTDGSGWEIVWTRPRQGRGE